jgi:peptidoglycan/LPS O-acetylase OafA/YrhL
MNDQPGQPNQPDNARRREPQLDLANLADIAAWIATAAASGVIGSATFAFVDNFRRRFGTRRIDELERQVFKELKRVKRKPHVADADLRLRVETLFDRYREG